MTHGFTYRKNFKKSKETKQTHRNKEKTDDSQRAVGGERDKKVKGNIVNNSMITLHGDR